jgi:CoA:oxalate CoA-transferase
VGSQLCRQRRCDASTIGYLQGLTDEQTWWDRQEEIEELLAAHLKTGTTQHWLDILDAADVWCAPVLTLEQLVVHAGFRAIDMTQQIRRPGEVTESGEEVVLTTTRSPIRIDGQVLTSTKAAPKLGQHNDQVSDLLARR